MRGLPVSTSSKFWDFSYLPPTFVRNFTQFLLLRIILIFRVPLLPQCGGTLWQPPYFNEPEGEGGGREGVSAFLCMETSFGELIQEPSTTDFPPKPSPNEDFFAYAKTCKLGALVMDNIAGIDSTLLE